MKSAIYILLISFFNIIFSQKELSNEWIGSNKNAIYMVCRGTSSKIGFIKDFNLYDKNITHVGIGIVNNNSIYVYNVNNENNVNGNLFVEKLEVFNSRIDIKYLSIWKYESNENEIKRLKVILKSYTKKKISFDMKFEDNGDETFYCSEFCATVFKKLKCKKLKFHKTKVELGLIYRNTLNRKYLKYYSVDFFQNNKNFIKVYEKFY